MDNKPIMLQPHLLLSKYFILVYTRCIAKIWKLAKKKKKTCKYNFPCSYTETVRHEKKASFM